MKTNQRSLRLVLITLLMFLCIQTATAAEGGNGEIDWARGYATAQGYGAAPNDKKISDAQEYALNEAESNARRALYEAIKGVQIDSTTTIADALLRDDRIRIRVENALQKAMIIRREAVTEKEPVTATVELKICITSRSAECAQKPALLSEITIEPEQAVKSLEHSRNSEKLISSPLPAVVGHTRSGLPSGWKPARYDLSRKVTGVIFVLTGYNFNKVPLPMVVTEQSPRQVVYSFKLVDPEMLRTHGAVRYAFSIEDAISTNVVGDNPVIVTAISVGSDNQINILQNDAAAINETLGNGNDYLKNARVVVVN